MSSLQNKIRGNVDRMLQFLYQIIGYPKDKKHVLTPEHKYECYAIFTHAVEEYGKLLYLRSLSADETGKYTIDYANTFTNHKPKFKLALDELPKSIKVVYDGSFDSEFFDSNLFDTDVEATWNNRLNVLNVDIDNNGNPTDIDFLVEQVIHSNVIPLTPT